MSALCRRPPSDIGRAGRQWGCCPFSEETDTHIHPDFGVLPEDANFVDVCARKRLIFVGPYGDIIRKAGFKSAERELIRRAGVPIELVSDGAIVSGKDASASDVGQGIHCCDSPEQISSAYQLAKRETQARFGNDELYLEKLVF